MARTRNPARAARPADPPAAEPAAVVLTPRPRRVVPLLIVAVLYAACLIALAVIGVWG